MEPVSKIDKRGDLNKRGGRKIFLKSINGEALIRVSRVEKISDNNKRASPFIRKVRVIEITNLSFCRWTRQNRREIYGDQDKAGLAGENTQNHRDRNRRQMSKSPQPGIFSKPLGAYFLGGPNCK